jgi:hypothetical protein
MTGRDPIHDHQVWLEEDERRRRRDAILAWLILSFAAFGVAVAVFTIVGYLIAILG